MPCRTCSEVIWSDWCVILFTSNYQFHIVQCWKWSFKHIKRKATLSVDAKAIKSIFRRYLFQYSVKPANTNRKNVIIKNCFFAWFKRYYCKACFHGRSVYQSECWYSKKLWKESHKFQATDMFKGSISEREAKFDNIISFHISLNENTSRNVAYYWFIICYVVPCVFSQSVFRNLSSIGHWQLLTLLLSNSSTNIDNFYYRKYTHNQCDQCY